MSLTLILSITVVIGVVIIVIILYYVQGYAIRQCFSAKWAGVGQSV